MSTKSLDDMREQTNCSDRWTVKTIHNKLQKSSSEGCVAKSNESLKHGAKRLYPLDCYDSYCYDLSLRSKK